MIRVSAKKFNMVEDKFHLELFEEYLKIYAQMQYLMVQIENYILKKMKSDFLDVYLIFSGILG